MIRPLLLSLLLIACGDDAARDAGSDAGTDAGSDAGADAGSDAAPAELRALASAPPYADENETITLDASDSTGALTYAWDLGDGRQIDASSSPTAEASWPVPGRYSVVLTVTGPSGSRTDGVVVTVTAPRVHTPTQSSTIAALPGGRIVALSTDANLLTVIRQDDFSVVTRIATPDDPRTVTPWMRSDGLWLAVPCQRASTLLLVRDDDSSRVEIPMPRASRPYGALPVGDRLFVSLQGTGELAEIVGDTLVARREALPDARGVSLTPDGRIAVTRWRSPDDEAEVAFLDPDGDAERVTLAFDPQESTDTESGGVPSYLDQVLFDPTGVLAALPATQANIADGTFRNGKALTFETSVRGMVAFLEAGEGTFAEDFDARRLFDNRGLAAAGVFSSRGDYLFVALRGHRAIERLDVLNASQSGTILNTGYAPDGVALSDDDRFLFVNASLSRLVQVYDVTSFDALPVPIAEVSLVEAEPLDPEILRGKQLFNDSFDPRLARDGYIACAHCHLEGDSDHRVWDFTDRGEGLRRTPPLFGRMDNLPLHWSGNFDEVQDFENDIRGPFGGSGLMATPDFREREDTLGVPKAGQSEELDALAAYVNSLTEHLSSPFRDSAGDLTEAATRGRAVFLSAGCPTCHEGSELTDSGFVSPGVPRLHDVGTLGPGSGSRLGEPLTGLDTPTLHGLWHQASFLHDGSATLEEVIGARNASDTHGNTSTLSETERADLVSYLLSLDGRVD